MRTLVLGGSGNFGARIVRALAKERSMEVVALSRRGVPVPGAETARSMAFDIDAPGLFDRLRALSPGLVIHCIGPFQGQDYRVASAALGCGAHYLDLSDGREFVTGFRAANDAAARSADRTAFSGASTLPALSSAVVDALREPLQSLERVEIAIAPGQRAPRGKATLEAVFSYLGRPFAVWRGRRWQNTWGWMDLHRVRFDIGTRWAAACDVPDLGLFPERYPQLNDVEFHAALEVGIQHFGLWLLAAIRRAGVPLAPQRCASALSRVASVLEHWGGPFGGMRICVVGLRDDSVRVRRIWHLTTPAMHGPEIPCLAAILLARRIAQGAVSERGAHPCMGFLALKDFEPEFYRWGIQTRMEDVVE